MIEQPPDSSRGRRTPGEVANSGQPIPGEGGRPVVLDLGLALSAGTVFALGLSGQWLPALLVLAVSAIVTSLLGWCFVRQRRRVLDQRTLGAGWWRFALVYLGIVLLALFEPPADWQPWFAILSGLVVAVLGFAWLRWESRYQERRLSTGDYHRLDLL